MPGTDARAVRARGVSRTPVIPPSLWTALVLVAITVYTAYFSLYTTLLHLNFGTTAYDMGTVDQGVWLAGRTSGLFVTVRGLPLLGDHVRPIAFVLAPIYWVWDDPRLLLVVQTVAIAAGGWFLYLIARRELAGSPGVAAVIPVSYLLNPFVQNLNLDHVHPDAFASTFILASIYFLRTARHVALWVAVVLAMACKEDVPLVYVALGSTLLFGQQRRLGIALMAVAGVYFAACVGLILPYFNDVGFFRADRFVPRPKRQGFIAALFARLVRAESGAYLFALLLPFGFLALLAPVTVVPGLPQVLANLLSEVRYPRDPSYHYATSIVPFLYLGTIAVIRRLAAIGAGRSGGRFAPIGDSASSSTWAAVAVAAVLLACAVAANLTYAKVPLTKLDKIATFWRVYTTSPANAEIFAGLGRIPRDAAVSADYTLVPHLSHRHRIYMFPNPFVPKLWGIRNENPHDPASIEYIIVRPGVMAESQKQVIEPLLAAGTFERIGNEKAVRVYRRVKP